VNAGRDGMLRSFFRSGAEPTAVERLVLGSLLFLVLAGGYVVASYYRHLENPDDQVMPTVGQLVDGVRRTAFEPDRDGELRLWTDTVASARRFGISLAILFLAVPLGVAMGTFPYVEALVHRFLVFFDKIPALSVLPILFIAFGLGELSKIALIVIGVFPTIALDAHLRAKAVPRERVMKAKTLGASEPEIAVRVVFPAVLPYVMDTIRLNLKAVMLLLIAGESLAATVGLGYRIFVVRRYLAMDIIIPYVVWMTVLLFLADWAMRAAIERPRRFQWVKNPD
jgi:NitT/TauT family transport system permease protein